jgi:hypothetical protein
MCDLLELLVRILDKLQSRVSKFLKLRRNKIDKHVNRGESWKAISLVHLDCLLNVHIVILRARFESLVFLVQVIEAHLNFGTSRKIGFSCILAHDTLGIVSAGNSVFIGLDKICDHVPEDLNLLA